MCCFSICVKMILPFVGFIDCEDSELYSQAFIGSFVASYTVLII